jgi:phosphoribosylglycinamide formyltransferase-1
MATIIGADSMTFLSTEQVSAAFGRTTREQCTFCLGGSHPVYGEQEVFPRRERGPSARLSISVFVSGSGTNLREIIRGVETGDIEADISSVVCNVPGAKAIARAEDAGAPVFVLPSKGRVVDPASRAAYFDEIAAHLRETMPDVVVLAGWKLILPDGFLAELRRLEIAVINLHPALLSRHEETHVATSRGRIPVLRGAHAIHDAFSLNLRVSGVTVHQVLPHAAFDTGPIVLKEEVARKQGEPWSAWEARMHETEHRVLPAALKRVLHVIKHNIDVSAGQFPW